MMPAMASDRLTRQELSWLLAQQARSAADLLRKGVTNLGTEPGPVPGDVSSTLDALDDAMRTLASLQTGGAPHTRRGRIDVAALLLELAPGASISLAPGSGTEVFGDESELRRMLQVLVSLGVTPSGAATNMPSAPIAVRRVGENIRIMVALGPDSSVSSPMEQAWLHRMSTRHGGKFELDSGQVVLELPADADNERREVQVLRKELAAAQEQGEAYARELATMFSRADSSAPPPLSAAVSAEGPSHPLHKLCRALSAHLRPELQALARGRSAAQAEGEKGRAQAEGEKGRAQAAALVVEELHRFSQPAADEAPAPRELGTLVRGALAEAESRADRRGVTLIIEATTGPAFVRPATFEALCYLLVSHAVEVTPREGQVKISASAGADGLSVTVDDAGPAIPPDARAGLLSLELDGSPFGRPGTTGLFLAATLARRLGGRLELGDGVAGGARLRAVLPSNAA
jgi:two-component system, OmpR family, sensor kinase